MYIYKECLILSLENKARSIVRTIVRQQVGYWCRGYRYISFTTEDILEVLEQIVVEYIYFIAILYTYTCLVVLVTYLYTLVMVPNYHIVLMSCF